MSHLLVLVFALVWTVVQCSCPTMCHCRNYATDSRQDDFYTVATCTAIPVNISERFVEKLEEITFVDLNETNFEILLKNLYNIKRLSLKNTTISIDNFTIPKNITYLDLSRNNLQTLLDFDDDSCNISTLDVSHNQFSVLRNYSFRTMDVLEVLNVSYNNISVIEPETFEGLSNLKCLDLSGNYLKTLTHFFHPITSLQYLNVSNNLLDTLSEICFSNLIKLQQLDLSCNKLQKVAPGSLELPSLARLLLAGNRKLGSSGDAILVSTGRKLQTVDASGIGLQQVPPSMTPSIRTLKLAGNEIENINCGDLDSYPLLQLLDFTSNDLDFIEEDALGRLDSLTMLLLGDNKIREIPKSLPERLQVLRIERNQLEEIKDGDLQGLSKLEVLLLSDNKIRIIEAKAFSQLTSLVTLDLSRNPVSVLQAGCLLGPVSLQVLRLSGIQLISPAKDVSFPLSAPEHLITLDLAQSPGLARQFLADTAVLAASKQLQELDLSDGELDEIPSDLLHYLPQLRVLHLDGNKLNCSHLQWLASWMRRQDEGEYEKIICASPPALWGTLLTDLQDNEVDPPLTTTKPKILEKTQAQDIPISSGNWNVEASHIRIQSETPNNTQSYPEKLRATTASTLEDISGETNKINLRPNNTIKFTLTDTENAKRYPLIRSKSSYTKVTTVNQKIEPSREKSTTLFVDIVPNTVRHWNGTADELSSMENDVGKHSFHPGMIISFVGILGAIAAVVMFATKFSKKVPAAREDPEIEVSSLPSVMELW